MGKKTIHTKANRAILVCVIACILVLCCRLLYSDMANQPGILRNIRLGLELSLKKQFPGFHAWFHDNLFASFLMWIISAVPFFLLIFFVAKRFKLFHRIPKDWFNRFERKPIVKKVPPQPDPVVKEQPRPQQQSAPTENRRQTVDSFSVLQSLCGDVNGEDNKFATDRGVRVQMLSGDPKQRTDQILEWYGPEGAKAATVPISPQFELLLNMDDQGVPCIVGLSDLGDAEEHDWAENIYPLTPGEAQIIVRQSGHGTVDRLAITWLGGRNE